MSETEPASRFHEDTALFREAVNFTAAKTDFAGRLIRLIEKDYFCALLLAHLAPTMNGLAVFKGGTCLAKVLVGFYRLSEDLDFAVPLPVAAGRARRRKSAEPMKTAVGAVVASLPGVRLVEPLPARTTPPSTSGPCQRAGKTYHP